MKSEIPPYQTIDYITGAKKRAIKSPVPGWYISIADQKGRDLMPDLFAYTERERDGKAKFAKSISLYPAAVMCHRCWVHEEQGRKYHTPR